MKKNILLKLCILLFSLNSFGQIKASIYTENYFGLEVNISKKISSELRFKANNIGKDFNNEIILFYNLFEKKYYKFKLGLGVNYRLFESDGLDSFIFPFQFEIKPFEKYNYISIIFEPSIVSEIESNTYFRSLIGLKISL
jgi:hypothetical protein